MPGKVLTVADFPPLVQPGWGSPIEREVQRRIGIAVATYAYEIADRPIMLDMQWDWYACQIDRFMGTCHPILDEFFIVHFSPMTGMWIYDHPELDGIKRIFDRYYAAMKSYFEQPTVQRLLRR